MNERDRYFYVGMPATPTPTRLAATLEHLTGRQASSEEIAKMQRQLDVTQQDYAPGGQQYQTNKIKIR